MITIKAGDAYAKEKLAIIEQTVKDSVLFDVVAQGARLTAIECANTSQPYGTGQDAKDLGEKAVGGDISKVYKTASDAYDDIGNIRYKKLFWKSFQAGEYDVSQSALNQFGNSLAGVPIEPFDGGAAHYFNRNKTTGRVELNRPVMIVDKWQDLARYVEKRKDNVGFGKGGWADVARQLGSASVSRNLKSDEEDDISASWITSKASGLGHVSFGGTNIHPEITITSTVDYASEILNGGALDKAKKIARDKMLLNLEYKARYEMERLGFAA